MAPPPSQRASARDRRRRRAGPGRTARSRASTGSESLPDSEAASWPAGRPRRDDASAGRGALGSESESGGSESGQVRVRRARYAAGFSKHTGRAPPGGRGFRVSLQLEIHPSHGPCSDPEDGCRGSESAARLSVSHAPGCQPECDVRVGQAPSSRSRVRVGCRGPTPSRSAGRHGVSQPELELRLGGTPTRMNLNSASGELTQQAAAPSPGLRLARVSAAGEPAGAAVAQPSRPGPPAITT